ncbi:MAG: hypothetical protein R2706_14640 [Acidimicrobiales bacterium]
MQGPAVAVVDQMALDADVAGGIIEAKHADQAHLGWVDRVVPRQRGEVVCQNLQLRRSKRCLMQNSHGRNLLQFVGLLE